MRCFSFLQETYGFYTISSIKYLQRTSAWLNFNNYCVVQRIYLYLICKSLYISAINKQDMYSLTPNQNCVRLLFVVFSIICGTSQIFAQGVGFGTTNPQATLHVAGAMQYIPDTSVQPQRVVGIDDTGLLGEIDLGDNFGIVNNELTIINDSGADLLNIEDLSITTNTLSSGNIYHDFDIAINGVHQMTPIVRLNNSTTNYSISGFQGGIDGKHIYVLNETSVNVTFLDKSNGATASSSENQIILPNGSSMGLSGKGVAEFIYDGTINKWLLVNLRD